jgi:hypothetical protein
MNGDYENSLTLQFEVEVITLLKWLVVLIR